jgi:hypothetical protein
MEVDAALSYIETKYLFKFKEKQIQAIKSMGFTYDKREGGHGIFYVCQ